MPRSKQGSGLAALDLLVTSLRRERDVLVGQWVDSVFADLPAESVKLLKGSSDPFSNPMGTTIKTQLGHLFDALLDGLDPEQVGPRLDRILDIQCANEPSPGVAVAFVFDLKAIVCSCLGTALRDPEVASGCREFSARIDELALLAFDSYARTQKKIADIRVQEARRSTSTLRAMTRIAQAAEPGCGLGRDSFK